MLKLRQAGVEIPEDRIVYLADDELAYDSDFDEGDWVRVETGSPDNQLEELSVVISVDAQVKQWVIQNEIDLKTPLSTLLDSYYRTDQLIHSKLDDRE